MKQSSIRIYQIIKSSFPAGWHGKLGTMMLGGLLFWGMMPIHGSLAVDRDCLHTGDVSLDGQITAMDAQWAFQIALSVFSPSTEAFCAADCNGNDSVTAGDAQGIFYAALGLGVCVDLFPAETPTPVPTGDPDRFMLIPAGVFTMGSPDDPPELCREDREQPHIVTLTRDFYMQQTEVTQAQWENVFGPGSNPSFYTGLQRPVEQITFFDIAVFCNHRSTTDGFRPAYYSDENFTMVFDGTPPILDATIYWDPTADGYRLPTEAEWEFACRAGTGTAYHNGLDNFFCDEDPNLDMIAWYQHNAGHRTHDVGQKTPNDWQIYDMLGNVWEWTWDRYGDYPTIPVMDPIGADSGWDRSVRGGAICEEAGRVRSAVRVPASPSYPYY